MDEMIVRIARSNDEENLLAKNLSEVWSDSYKVKQAMN